MAKGYSQKYGIDYHQIFAPVARLETLRLLFALSAQFGLTVWQFDVVTAYLNGVLNEKILMKVPDMLREMLTRIVSKRSNEDCISVRARKMLADLNNCGSTYRLKKALYGLKQAGRQWYVKFSERLMSLGYSLL